MVHGQITDFTFSPIGPRSRDAKVLGERGLGRHRGWCHWFRNPLEPYHDFEIIRGVEALLNSLSFLAPPGSDWDALLSHFAKLEISSTITFGAVVGWAKLFPFATRDTSEIWTNITSHSCNSFLTRYGPVQNEPNHIHRSLPPWRSHCVGK
jgi:hypothetical protein